MVRLVASLIAFAGAQAGGARGPTLDERPAVEGEWGYRPADGAVSAVTPPSFCWRPSPGIVAWEIECRRGGDMAYSAKDVTFTVHCPPRTFAAGPYTWRYRGVDAAGSVTAWSRARSFRISAQARAMPLPSRSELLARIPKAHPRLLLRPEQLTHLRELANGRLRPEYEALVAECEELTAIPPPTTEPPKYPPGTFRNSDPWRKVWWGNRRYTIRALNGAATLAFTRLIGGNERYGRLAKRILMDCARWDPVGSTGYRYNDEAGMPYAYYFSRTYTFLHDRLSPEERAQCRRVMKVRGEEMYRHLNPRHLWQPYSSHSNRAWHFLGEVGVAFLDEIEGADDWVWFATNVFFNVYPVWSDDDGGWHEGASYWSSYLNRFTWWADVMRTAMGIDAYDRPFFSEAGYYAMYGMPPGKVGGGFGDLTARRRAAQNVPLMTILAAQAGNGHWQWYVDEMGGPASAGGYIGFLRGALPRVMPLPPEALPASRLFRGTGQAFLNTSLWDAANGVQVAFKSSPFGTQSHGYEANNSFLLSAYGQRLLIRSGYRDSYGSDHHRKWMWSTRSVNNITVSGRGQGRRTAAARGKIVAFKTTPQIDLVVGEAGSAYVDESAGSDSGPVKRFTRAIIFVKPELIIVYDRLRAAEPSTFEYWLHAVNRFGVRDTQQVHVRAADVRCEIEFLAPTGLEFSQTNQYDPNPRPRIKLREWHLTATTPDKRDSVEFVTLYRPHRATEPVAAGAELKRIVGGYALRAAVGDGDVVALLPAEDNAKLHGHGLVSDGQIVVRRRRADGTAVRTVSLDDAVMGYGK